MDPKFTWMTGGHDYAPGEEPTLVEMLAAHAFAILASPNALMAIGLLLVALGAGVAIIRRMHRLLSAPEAAEPRSTSPATAAMTPPDPDAERRDALRELRLRRQAEVTETPRSARVDADTATAERSKIEPA